MTGGDRAAGGEPAGVERRRSVGRRATLAATASAVAAGLAGCLGDIGGSDSSFQDQLDAARASTSQYADPESAMADGFEPFGPYVPGMGWHFQHPARGQAAAREGFDVEEPNLLTYVEGDEGLQLGAVEWGAPVEAVPSDPDLFDDDGAETWHVHEAATHVFALPDDTRTPPPEVPFAEWVTNDNWAEFRPPDPDLEAGATTSLNWGSHEAKSGDRTERVVDVVATHPDLNTLHAWVHVENPEGVLAPVNPRYGSEHGH